MALQKADILGILQTNYKNASALMPSDLAAEFQNKILTPDLLQEYAEKIYVAIQFRDETGAIRIENWLIERLMKGGFNKKLTQNGMDSVKVYETLLDGFFDYRK